MRFENGPRRSAIPEGLNEEDSMVELYDQMDDYSNNLTNLDFDLASKIAPSIHL